jgi:succinate-semialdehyde dehydrogenase/glutarate-semialdehyde dehydrogenase
MSYQSINPYTGKLVKKFKELTNAQLEKALKTAAATFETWRVNHSRSARSWWPKPPR